MPAHEIRLKCLPDQEPDTSVVVDWGWSRAEGLLCVYVKAANRLGEITSETVEMGYPVDCLPVPEPSGLGVGLAMLALVARSRLWPRSGSGRRRVVRTG